MIIETVNGNGVRFVPGCDMTFIMFAEKGEASTCSDKESRLVYPGDLPSVNAVAEGYETDAVALTFFSG